MELMFLAEHSHMASWLVLLIIAANEIPAKQIMRDYHKQPNSRVIEIYPFHSQPSSSWCPVVNDNRTSGFLADQSIQKNQAYHVILKNTQNYEHDIHERDFPEYSI